MFEQLARHVLLHSGATSANSKSVHVIDSTTLVSATYKWAEFRQTKAGIKIHLRVAFVEKDGVVPERATNTPAKKKDRTQKDALIDEEGATYVFDWGYLDYKMFVRYSERGIYFITRLKNNVAIEPLESFPIPAKSNVTMDERVRIGIQEDQVELPHHRNGQFGRESARLGNEPFQSNV